MCTLALFLSGYAIQQRTLNNLREAIRPRTPRPQTKPHLPDRFKARVTELEDGTFAFMESEAEEEAREQREMMVQVKQSTPESLDQRPAESASSKLKQAGKPTAKQLEILEAIKAKVAAQSWVVENPDPSDKSKVPISAAERRQMIREELQKLAGSEQYVYYQRRLW